ncbi:acetyl-CoA carboxylase biotin carboxyl carrier protein [Sphaerisporangium flaviroseum]|uniref:Biotin carboxyl carrier protein of acetyl-CoA carboxylase n=1 Tax=Sphaerisporangium flaviroseum TaxID=509199 RepID=A0ABP7JJB9_9ACTN
MTAESTRVDEREQVLDWVVRHATQLGHASPAPLRRITVSTATLAIDVEWSATQAPGTQSHASETQPAPAAESTGTAPILLTAPMVGTFYRAQEPGAPPFVEVGDLVEVGQQVGIIEAMKLMNAVQAEHRGRVSEIVATDGAPVQYEEPLLALVPADGH